MGDDMSSATPEIPDIPSVPSVPSPVKRNTFQLMKETWRGFSKKQKFQLVAVFALVLGLPTILGGVYTAKYIGSRAQTPITPPITPPVYTPPATPTATPIMCRDDYYYGGTYGPTCGTTSSYYLDFYCPDNTVGVVGDSNMKTCYNMNDLIGMALKFCSNNHNYRVCSTPTPVSSPSATPIATPVSIIRVITPNGGETLISGQTYKITWRTSSDITSVSIYYFNSQAMQTIVNNLPNSGYYNWVIPTIQSGMNNTFRIQIMAGVSGTTILDYSDNYFTILLTATPTATPRPIITPTPIPGTPKPTINPSPIGPTPSIKPTSMPTIRPTPTPTPIRVCRFRIFGFCLIWR